MKFGVQLGITNNIWVGNINKKENMFINKEDKTVEVLKAAIDLIQYNDSKDKTTELSDNKHRYILELRKVNKD